MADMGMVEKVARAICRAIAEKETAEAQFAYEGLAHEGGHPQAKLDIDIDGMVEESWPDYAHAARLAIKESTETFVRIRDWDHDEAWQARGAYEAAVREVDAILKEEGNG